MEWLQIGESVRFEDRRAWIQHQRERASQKDGKEQNISSHPCNMVSG